MLLGCWLLGVLWPSLGPVPALLLTAAILIIRSCFSWFRMSVSCCLENTQLCNLSPHAGSVATAAADSTPRHAPRPASRRRDCRVAQLCPGSGVAGAGGARLACSPPLDRARPGRPPARGRPHRPPPRPNPAPSLPAAGGPGGPGLPGCHRPARLARRGCAAGGSVDC